MPKVIKASEHKQVSSIRIKNKDKDKLVKKFGSVQRFFDYFLAIAVHSPASTILNTSHKKREK